MWNLAKKKIVLASVCLGLVPATWAAGAGSPFVAVSLPKGPLVLNDGCGPDGQKTQTRIAVHVVANCPYYLKAGFPGLAHESTKVGISSQRVSVVINGKDVPVGQSRTAIVGSGMPTTVNGVDVPLDVQITVTGLALYAPGAYDGSLVITAVPRL